MAVTFDGPNLTITLESGVTSLAWVDVYSDWKRWVNDGGGDPYAPAFRVVGGDPLSAVINAGAYFFLRNDLGWRIKPPEEDITVFVTGNLALEDLNANSVLPTTGAFTAAILGLQPVTQGVVPSMKANLEFNTFQGAVCIDQQNISGNATAGTGSVGGDRVGTRRVPVDNLDDALLIATANGLHTFNLVSDLVTTTETTDLSAGYIFKGDSPFIIFTAVAGLNLLNCAVDNLELSGVMDGVNDLIQCRVKNISDHNGQTRRCDLMGDVAINGNIILESCYSGLSGASYPRVTSIGTDEVIVRDLSGSLGVAGMTGGNHSIGLRGGRLIIEATCSGGTIHVRSSPYDITDLSGGAVTIIDQTESLKTTEVWRRLALDPANPLTNESDGGLQATDIDIVATPSGDDIIQTRQ